MDNSRPMVSVLMNCHNCSDFLSEAIDSVYAQSYSNWQIIFFDNASNDESSNIAKNYDSKLKYFFNNKKMPLGNARNLALSKAEGEFVAFLDCDDEFLPNKLHDQVSIMQKYNVDMCYGSTFHIDNKSNIIRKKRVRNKVGDIFSKLLIQYNINMQSVMIRRNFLKNHNLTFDQSLSFSPDYDLFMEIALLGRSCSLSKYLSKYRLHSKSLTHKSQHLICKEGLYTLDRLEKKYGNINKKYSFYLDYAKSVFRMQEAISCLQNNSSDQAKKVLIKKFPIYPKSLILLFLIYIGLSPRLILIIIRRAK
jgi:glycosyltransferase involved in cell wall biosynthesis